MLRKSIYVGFTLLCINSHAFAATLSDITSIYGIQDYVDTYLGSSGEFYGGDSTDTIDPGANLTDQTELAHATYAMTNTMGGYVDIGFADGIYNGPGTDLIFFFFGGLNPDTITTSNVFDLDIDIGGPLLKTTYNSGQAACTAYPASCISPTDTLITVTSPVDGTFTLTLQLVDLDDFGLAGTTEVNNFRVYLGNDSYPALSLVGGIHTQAVPLPLPIVLFGSGLALLGYVGRRKR